MDAKTIARFWSNTEKTAGCWNWKLAKDRDGYGQVKCEGRTQLAHRVAYRITNGEIPEGMQIDHTCHNASCCNPDHLRLVTPKQNSENMAGAYRNNTTGTLGVTYVRKTNKFMVRVSHNGQYYYGGSHATLDLATKAAAELRNSLFTHNDADRRQVA